MSNVPTTIEDLRTKYKVMANMFLLAQMRQPSRHLYRGLEVNTLSDFLDELLSDRNFLMESDDDEKLVIPPWTQCLSYEFNIRKDAVRLCMEEGFALKDALWHVLADKEHRMQLWILKLTIANARQDVSRVQKLEQRLASLEKQKRRSRSRSPRRQAQLALPAPQQQLALPAKRTGRNRKGSGKGKNRKSEFRPFFQILIQKFTELYPSAFDRSSSIITPQRCARNLLAIRAPQQMKEHHRQVRAGRVLAAP